MASAKSEKPSNIFTSNNYLRNYLTSIIYVKEHFYMFFSTMKEIILTQSKTNHWIAFIHMIICLKHI